MPISARVGGGVSSLAVAAALAAAWIVPAALTLSNDTISEGAANGGLVGHIQGISPGSTLTLVNSAGGKFALSGTDINKAAALDYESATSHNITIRETNPLFQAGFNDTVITIHVSNVLEVHLAALTLSANTVPETSAGGTGVGTVVGSIVGLSAGSTKSLVDSAGGRFAISAGNIVVNGVLDYETLTSHNITIQEDNNDADNSGRQTTLTINVSDVAEQDPHRYWRIRVTAAMNGGNLAAFSNVVMAERIGGAHMLGAVAPTASSTNFGAVANVQDASVGTIFVSNGNPATITWDLGATAGNWKDIRSCRINVDPAWHPQGPKTFSIQYSDDGATWFDRITVASEVGWDGSVTQGWRARIFSAATQPLAALPGYLWYRLNITAGNDVTQVAIGELEFRATVGGADLTVPGSPAFYSQQAGGNPWSSAYDNNVGSGGYFGTTGFPYLVGLELAQRAVLAQVSIVPYPGFNAYAPKNFTVQGSNDFATWDTVKTLVNETAWAANPTARLYAVP
jgi:hypothetical protein